MTDSFPYHIGITHVRLFPTSYRDAGEYSPKVVFSLLGTTKVRRVLKRLGPITGIIF